MLWVCCACIKPLARKESKPPVSPWFCLCVQDFIADRDVMPSITMENNVIHNNEGYGVIVVKPNNQEEWRASQHASEGMWSSQQVMINKYTQNCPQVLVNHLLTEFLTTRVKADQHWINP